MTKTEAKWVARVREWAESGRTASEFAEGQDYAASTLRYWASRLRTKEPGSAAASALSAELSRDPPRVRLVRVQRTARKLPEASQTSVPKPVAETAAPSQIAPSPQGASSNAALVIALGAARIEVRHGFDARLLSDVVEALRGAQ
jgi:hypothetical protein